ncbi:hypothetical protein EII29_02480 [Leptotrichia sp. OH3620_COT-345]|uniref:PBECR4 domain-containing protein n=1 Tax=Leptotrichia sp. OH3620_COT-345 TaxID=2491048 RepID=UPI000F64CB59|nr:PBECR4 domain-containing protein [Leptotrichia sp. OH3620_COT-345]RRD40365.1 hypothetical protein EII29_02480 [Leptotrichia sp. OH3620_COT-345]
MREQSYKVQEIFKWFSKYDKEDICIKSKSKEFFIEINNKSLPHLLGLQYINDNESKHGVLKGQRLYNKINEENLSDQDIYDLIAEHNANKIDSVANRINTFKEFMENLENGYIFEQTNQYTQIKSNYLVVQTKNNQFLHLGIRKEEYGDIITEFEVDNRTKDILETYFAREDINYFENSRIFEKITEISKYNDKTKKYELFSFKEDKEKHFWENETETEEKER